MFKLLVSTITAVVIATSVNAEVKSDQQEICEGIIQGLDEPLQDLFNKKITCKSDNAVYDATLYVVGISQEIGEFVYKTLNFTAVNLAHLKLNTMIKQFDRAYVDPEGIYIESIPSFKLGRGSMSRELILGEIGYDIMDPSNEESVAVNYINEVKYHLRSTIVTFDDYLRNSKEN